MKSGTMRGAAVLAALLALSAADAGAQQVVPAEGLRLSPGATQQLQHQEKTGQSLAKYRTPEIRDLGGGHGEGVSYHENDVFVGTFRRSASPYNGKIRPWVLDQGIYAK